ncbi:MAG: hypothetical protein WC889_06890, partial [Myxococcota bacterium]
MSQHAASGCLPDQQPCGFDRFRLCATTTATSTAICNDFDANAGKAGVALSVPPGTWSLSFQGYSTVKANTVVWCGKTAGVKVSKSERTEAKIFISQCSDFTLSAGSMKSPRAFHTATALADGRVLIAGGVASLDTNTSCDLGCQWKDGAFKNSKGEACVPLCRTSPSLNTAELYDPATGVFSAVLQGMQRVRAFHTATTLADGRVLIAGGTEEVSTVMYPGASPSGPYPFLPSKLGSAAVTSQVFDPATGAFSLVSAGTPTPRAMHAAALTKSGKVALFGGFTTPETGNNYPMTDMIDLCTDSVFTPALLAKEKRAMLTALEMPNQDPNISIILLWGGNLVPPFTADLFAEVFQYNGTTPRSDFPANYAKKDAGGLPQFMHTAMLLPDQKRILLAGGMFPLGFTSDDGETFNAYQPVRDIRIAQLGENPQIFRPGADEWRKMRYPRAMHTASALPNGMYLMAGGFTARDPACASPVCFVPTPSAEFFMPSLEQFDTIHPAGLPVDRPV